MRVSITLFLFYHTETGSSTWRAGHGGGPIGEIRLRPDFDKFSKMDPSSW